MAVAKGETYVERLTDILVEQKAVPQKEAQAIKKSFKKSEQAIFDVFLLEEGLVEKEDLLAALSEYYQVPAFDALGYFFNRILLQQFPKDFLLRCEIIPLEVDENMLIIVAAEPNSPNLLNLIGEQVSYDIRFRVGITLDICDAVKEFYDKSETSENYDIDFQEQRRETRQEISMDDQTERIVRYTEDEEK